MGVRARQVSLLLYGTALLALTFTVYGGKRRPVYQSPDGFNNFGNFGGGTQDFSGARINSGAGGTRDSFNNRGGGTQSFRGARINSGGSGPNSAGTSDSFNNEGGGTSDFTGASIDSGGGNSNSFNRGGGFGDFFKPLYNPLDSLQRLCNVVEIKSTYGLTLRGLNVRGNIVSSKNKKVFMGDKVICEDVTKAPKEPTYQKTADGALWHTNIQIGEAMNQAEILQFEADWAKHIQEEETKAAERETNFRQSKEEERNRKYQKMREEQRPRPKMVAEKNQSRPKRTAGRRGVRRNS